MKNTPPLPFRKWQTITLLLLFCSLKIFAQSCTPTASVSVSPSATSVCAGSCATLTATGSTNYIATTTYSVTTTAYAPYSFTAGTQVFNIDDEYSNVVNLPFTFCYFGQSYNQCVVGANGQINFNTVYATFYDPWDLGGITGNNGPGGPLPGGNTNDGTKNCIMGAYYDIDPAAGGSINMAVYGTAPCRSFVVSWSDIPLYTDLGTVCVGQTGTQQIVLHESTNQIDVFIKDKPLCTGWNGGLAILGIENASGTVVYTAPGKNCTQWSESLTGYSFVPDQSSISTSYTWYDQGGAQIGTSASITVCPTVTTTYTAKYEVNECNGPSATATSTVTVYPFADISIGGSVTICNGSSYDIPITGTFSPGVSINYTDPNGNPQTINLTDPWLSTGVLTTPGNYVYTLNGANGTGPCDANASGSFTVTVLPAITATVAPTVACAFQPITISGAPNEFINYELIGPSGTDAGDLQLDNSGNYVYDLPAGTYTLNLYYGYFDGSPACTTALNQTYTLTVNPLPVASITDAADTICNGDHPVIPVTGTPGAVVYYSVSGNGGAEDFITLNGSGDGNIIYDYTNNGLYPLTYTVTVTQVTDTTTSCTGEGLGTVTITVWPTPAVTMHGLDTTVCPGDTSIIQFDGIPGSYAYYTLDGVADSILILPPDGVTNIFVPGINPGGTPVTHTYILQRGAYIHYPYCSTPEDQEVTLTVNPAPTVTITEAPKICVPPGGVVLHANGADAYVWTPAGGLSCLSCADPTATPTVTTQYIVTGFNAYGCSGTDTVIADPFPVIAFNPADTTICFGTSVNINAQPGIQYTWTPGATINCLTPDCDVVTASPTVTTTYTVIGVDGYGCADTTTYTVNVDTLPKLDTFLLTGPGTVCNGSPSALYFEGTPNTVVTFTANGNSTQVTLDGTGHFTLSVSPTVTTTYDLVSIAYVNPPNCPQTITGEITITVLPVATVKFTPSAGVYCPLSSTVTGYTLHPITTNVNTFVWASSPNDPTLNPAILEPTVNPTVTTTYYLTVYANDTCPPETDSFRLEVPRQSCVCNTFCQGVTPQAIGAWGVIDSDISAGQYYIDGDVTVKGTVHFTQALVTIANGVTINVDTTAVMELNGAHLFDCDSLWKGVVLKSTKHATVPFTGHFVAQQGSLIEDADTAVYTDSGYVASIFTNTSLTPANEDYVIYTDDAIFNHNLYSLEVADFHDSTVQVYPFHIQNTVFTSRKMNANDGNTCTDNYPYTWPTVLGTNGLKTLWAGVPNNYEPPYNICNPAGSVNGTAFVPSYCHNGKAPYAGIMLRNVGYCKGTSNEFYNINIGTDDINSGYYQGNSAENLFDSTSNGVTAYNADMLLLNNAFIHMHQTLPTTSGIIQGDGVYAASTNEGKYNAELNGLVLSAEPALANWFYDCINGVESYDYYRLKALQTVMFSDHQVGVANTYNTGIYGIFARSSNYELIDLSSNYMNNLTNGIAFFSTFSGSGTSSAPDSTGLIDVSHNVVTSNISGPALPGPNAPFTAQAIVVENLANPANQVYNRVRLIGNAAENVYNGITVMNFQATAITNINTVQLVNNAAATTIQTGIEHANCIGDYISNNYIFGPGYNVPPINPLISYSGHIIKGLLSQTDKNFTVGCNESESFNTGVEFTGTGTGVFWQNNMDANTVDFVLNNAAIGTQGSTTQASNNTWTGSSTLNSYVINLASSGSILWVLGPFNSMYSPTVNNGSPVTARYINGSSIKLITASGGGDTLHCDTFNAPPGFETMFQTAENALAFASPFAKRQSWMAQQGLMRVMEQDSTVTDTSVILQQFKAMAVNSRFHYLHQIEDKIVNRDFATATAMLAAPMDSLANTDSDIVTGVRMADDTGANIVVGHYRKFYHLYMKYLQGAMSQDDSTQVLVLASLCPLIDGDVVYQARSLYALTTHDLTHFPDNNCDTVMRVDTVKQEERKTNGGGNYTDSRNSNAVTDKAEGQSYSLHPNPSNGDVYIQQLVDDKQPVKAAIFNDAGQTVYKTVMQFKDRKEHVHYDDLLSGLYLMQLTDSQGRVFVLKFNVIK